MTQEQEATPSFTIEKLYVKDLSLEVPNAPEIFLDQETPERLVKSSKFSAHHDADMHTLATR